MIGIIMAEVFREFIYFKRYIFERISSITMLIFIFLGFIYSSAHFVNGEVVIDKFSVSQKLIGFTIWFFALDAVGHLSSALREDLHIGILEQIALTPYSLIFNMLGRSVARFIITFINGVVILIIFNIIFELNISVPLSALPFLILTYLGLYGLGLFFAGLTLIFKRLGPITTITRFLLLIFTGAVIPLHYFPETIQHSAALLPMTEGLNLIRGLILGSADLYNTISSKSMAYLIINTSVYFSIGVITFIFLEKRARRLGTLGSY